ncbi:MAG: methionyl-tRNA formyltransferase [Anaerohalosphaeraceae bacterium]|nr:methionyl-tRNA formyltransferase [Anaerohalosphaeraceae bacterium]
MKIVYCGCGRFGIESVERIAESSHELVHIITHPAKPAGRGRKSRPNDVAQWAAKNNVDFTEIADSNSPEGIELLKSLSPDLVVVIAFGQKVSQEFISISTNGAINVHASLLPKYRGAAPINWAIINGEKKTGVSIITLAETMDAGEILACAELDILPEDTAGSLHDRLAELSGGLLLETIDKIAAGSTEYVKQDSSLVTLAPKLKKADGIIGWRASAEQINNKIRGLWPWPAAQSDFVSSKNAEPCRVIIASAEVVPGTVSDAGVGSIDENLNVICGDGALKILQIKPQGGKIMDFKSFLNGRGSGLGDCFKGIEEKQL